MRRPFRTKGVRKAGRGTKVMNNTPRENYKVAGVVSAVLTVGAALKWAQQHKLHNEAQKSWGAGAVLFFVFTCVFLGLFLKEGDDSEPSVGTTQQPQAAALEEPPAQETQEGQTPGAEVVSAQSSAQGSEQGLAHRQQEETGRATHNGAEFASAGMSSRELREYLESLGGGAQRELPPPRPKDSFKPGGAAWRHDYDIDDAEALFGVPGQPPRLARHSGARNPLKRPGSQTGTNPGRRPERSHPISHPGIPGRRARADRLAEAHARKVWDARMREVEQRQLQEQSRLRAEAQAVAPQEGAQTGAQAAPSQAPPEEGDDEDFLGTIPAEELSRPVEEADGDELGDEVLRSFKQGSLEVEREMLETAKAWGKSALARLFERLKTRAGLAVLAAVLLAALAWWYWFRTNDDEDDQG
ncbi:unnamed protein product, partial [Durusdinium trenchii]